MMRKIHDSIQMAERYRNLQANFHSLSIYVKSDRNSLLRTSYDEWAKVYRATISQVIQEYTDECQAGGEVQRLLEVSQTNWEKIFLKPRVPPKAATGGDYESEGEFPDYESEDEEPEDEEPEDD
jgi:hypothetical protein